jgi:hypothetical protein
MEPKCSRYEVQDGRHI